MSTAAMLRERLPDLLLVALLVVLGALAWHWQPRLPVTSEDCRDWLIAGAAALAYLVTCVWPAVRQRRRRARPPNTLEAGTLPVIHASQTGFAEQLAQRTAESLATAGVASRALSLADIDPARIATLPRALFVLSTTGEGDAPDAALRFVHAMEAGSPDLSGLRYGLLALGDRDYAQFCAFGRRVDAWLRQHGALPLFDMVEVDNGDPGALRHWQHGLRELADAPELPDWEAPRYADWTLHERRLLNPGSLGGPAFHLVLHPLDGALPDWEAGDIAEIGPRHAPAEVQNWLTANGFDGTQVIRQDGEARTLADWLATSHWPEPPATGTAAAALVASLTPLPHREYSIASLPADGTLELLVRQARRDDGSLGLGSGWLTAHAQVGARIALRVRRNSGFHPPEDDRPLVAIGNGTGIAGLRALLKARAARGHRRNWLLFGERQAAVDAFFADDIAAWRDRGMLTRADFAWSRDGGTVRYVQHALLAAGDTLREWVADGAAIHVCGSLDGMAGGVDAALRTLLGDAGVDALREQGRYRRDVY